MARKLTSAQAKAMSELAHPKRIGKRTRINRTIADVITAITEATTPEMVNAAVAKLWTKKPDIMLRFFASVAPKQLHLADNREQVIINMPTFTALPHQGNDDATIRVIDNNNVDNSNNVNPDNDSVQHDD